MRDRQLVAVMFTDMAGFSAIVQKDETLGLTLLERQREIVRATLPAHGGHEVETIGDAFLVTFDSALAALDCALAIQRALAALPEPRPLLRIGLHLGDIVRTATGIFGDSVNIAARVQALAPSGGIALSASLHQQVRYKVAFAFATLGPQQLKNIAEPLEVFALDAATIAVAKLREPPAGRTPRDRRIAARRLGYASLAVAGIVALAAAIFWSVTRPVTAADKSVAVLPFVNMSADADNQFFADGLHDSVLTHLARVRDLKVISRTSVEPYRNTKRNLREIGAELGVRTIIEASVQRVGQRLRVNAQAIDAVTDEHRWAADFDRDIADLFTVQAELASQIAAAVHATILPDERARIEERPTRDLEAYRLYQAVRHWWDFAAGDCRLYAARFAELDQALKLDPDFALAHALVAMMHTARYQQCGDKTPVRAGRALEAVQTALRLKPKLAEGHIALATYQYWVMRDYPAALRSYDAAEQLLPGHYEIYQMRGWLRRRLQQWGAAERDMRKSLELNPLSPGAMASLAKFLVGLRRYEEGLQFSEQAQRLAAGDAEFRLNHAMQLSDVTGDSGAEERVLAERGDSDCFYRQMRFSLAMQRGQPGTALEIVQNCDPATGSLPYTGVEQPNPFYVGLAQAELGQHAAARASFLQSIAESQRAAGERPDDPQPVAALALAQAWAGQPAEAQRTIERALTMAPDAVDWTIATQVRGHAAAVYARIGKEPEAIALLSELLTRPFGPTVHRLRRDAILLPLWQRKDFKQLLATTLAQT